MRPVNPNDYKVSRQRKSGKDLVSLVGTLSDSRAKNRLSNWIRTFDLSKIKENDFAMTAKGWQGLLELALFIGPLGARYRETIKLCTSIMAGYTKTQKDYLEIKFPRELTEQWESLKEEMLNAAEPLMEPDKFREFKSRMGK